MNGPFAPQQSIDPKQLVTKGITPLNKPAPPSSLLEYLNKTGQIKTPGVNPAIKPIQSMMKPMSQERPATNSSTLPNGQPIIAGNVSPSSLKSQTTPYDDLYQDFQKGMPVSEVSKLYPEYKNVDSKILEDLRIDISKGMPSSEISRLYPELNQGSTTPMQGGVRRGAAGLSTDLGAYERLNPVGKLATNLNNKVNEIKPVSKTNIANAFNKLLPGFGDFMMEGNGPNPLQVIANTPQSLLKTITATLQGVTNPIDTIEGLVRLVGTDEGHQTLKDRYGSVDNFSRSMSDDPVGVASDILTIFQGGAGIAGKGAKLAGATQFADDAARISNTAGAMADIGVPQAFNKVTGLVDGLPKGIAKTVAKTVIAPTQPLKTISGEKGILPTKETIKQKANNTADYLLSSKRKYTDKNKKVFAGITGKTPTERALEKGLVKGGLEETSSTVQDFKYKNMNDKLQSIKLRGQTDTPLNVKVMAKKVAETILKDLLDNTVSGVDDIAKLSPDDLKVLPKPLLDLYNGAKKIQDSKNIDFVQIEAIKQAYDHYNPDNLSYGMDGRPIARSGNEIKANNRQVVQKILESEGKKRGVDIKGINNNIQASTSFIKGAEQALNRMENNNPFGLMDSQLAILGGVLMDGGASSILAPVAGVVFNKAINSEGLRTTLAKKLYKNVSDNNSNIKPNTTINPMTDRASNYINGIDPKLSTRSIVLKSQGPLQNNPANAMIKPKGPVTTITEKGTASRPGTTKVDPKEVVKQIESNIKAKAEQARVDAINNLRTDPKLQELGVIDIVPSNVKGKGYVTQYGPIDRVAYDRGREVYEVGGKLYKADELKIFKPTEPKINPVAKAGELDTPDKKTVAYYNKINTERSKLTDKPFRDNVETLTYDEFESMSPGLRTRYDNLLLKEIQGGDEYSRVMDLFAKEVQKIEAMEQRVGKVGNKRVNSDYKAIQSKEQSIEKEQLISRIQEYADIDQFDAVDLYDTLNQYDIDKLTKIKAPESYAKTKKKETTQKIIDQIQSNLPKQGETPVSTVAKKTQSVTVKPQDTIKTKDLTRSQKEINNFTNIIKSFDSKKDFINEFKKQFQGDPFEPMILKGKEIDKTILSRHLDKQYGHMKSHDEALGKLWDDTVDKNAISQSADLTKPSDKGIMEKVSPQSPEMTKLSIEAKKYKTAQLRKIRQEANKS